jgi:hypothetical protein
MGLDDDECHSMKHKIFSELIKRQLPHVVSEKRLYYNDLKRVCKFLKESIFLENTCSLWTGYITNLKNSKKGTYINFYFKRKKKALHRLLYVNFVGELRDDEYIKFTCGNKGYCCSIYCMKKVKFNKKQDSCQSVNTNNQCLHHQFDINF